MLTAKGQYEHYENSFPNGITETWHYEGDSYENCLLTIVFQADYTLKARVHFQDNRLVRFDYHIDESLHGSYYIENGKLKVKRTLPYNTYLEDSLVWSDIAVLDLPFLSCKSHTILHLNAHGIAPTFAPILRSGDRAGDFAKKSVKFIAYNTVSLNQTVYSTKQYQYVRDYWLNEQDVVMRMRDNQYEVILVEYNP